MTSNVIHIINLNNFLEQNRLAQYLLSYNKTMEHNMEFKIWAEKDQDIKDALSLCKDSWAPDFRAGIFIPAYILYSMVVLTVRWTMSFYVQIIFITHF